MERKWYGITYPAINGELPKFVYPLWKKFMCPHGWHLLDESMSWVGGGVVEHVLYCDACWLEIWIDDKGGHQPPEFKGINP